MVRKQKEMRFKVAAYDNKMCSYLMVDNCSRFSLQQLEEEEIMSIKEINCNEVELAVFKDLDSSFNLPQQ